MQDFIFSYSQIFIPLCIYIKISISTDLLLVNWIIFISLTIVNNSIVNIGIPMSFGINVSVFGGGKNPLVDFSVKVILMVILM